MTDAAKLPLMLSELRMPTFGRLWQEMSERADREDWARPASWRPCASTSWPSGRRAGSPATSPRPACRRERRSRPSTSRPPVRSQRPCRRAGAGRRLDRARRHVLIFGPSGTGKTHVASAIGAGLIDDGYRVRFTRTTDLVQKLQAARRDLTLPATLAKLDKLDCLILDDLGYVRKDGAETSVLFELVAERYERRLSRDLNN